MTKRNGHKRKGRSDGPTMGKSVMLRNLSIEGRRRLSRRLLLTALVLVTVWITFFDSHSLVKRIGWHHEQAQLEAENEELRAEIERLEHEVDKGLSDEMVERIAREHYGMRRPGETVYRVKPSD